MVQTQTGNSNAIGSMQHPLKGFSGKVKFSYNAAKRVVRLVHSAYKQPGNTFYGVLPCHCNPNGNCKCGYQFGLCFTVTYTPKSKGWYFAQGKVLISVWWGVKLSHIGVGNPNNQFIGATQFSSGACALYYLIGLAQAHYNGTGHKWLNSAYPNSRCCYVPVRG